MYELQVGYGRVDVTPDYPVNMAGSAANRVSEGFLDPLYVTFIALKQEDKTFLLATMDFVGTYDPYAVPLREHISRTTGIPLEQVLLCSTHTHSSISVSNASLVNIPRYREDLMQWAEKAAKEALADLSPAEVWYGSIMTEGMVWVRHYKMADGTYAGANYGSFKKSAIVGHASEADGLMQLVKLARPAEDKKDIVMMSYPSHATMNGASTKLSADFPGPARDYVEKATGAHVAYFIGGAGDQVPSSRVPEESFSKDYQVYGAQVGRYAVQCLQNMKKVQSSRVSVNRRFFTGPSNKTDMERLPEARKVQAIWQQVGGRGTPEGRQAAKDHGFWSVYEVTALLNRVEFPAQRTIELYTLSIGELAFFFAPYEMFGASAMRIKGESPYDMTFAVSCANSHVGYLPSQLGCQIRCYEAQITKFMPGTADVLVEEFLDMLREMKKS